MSMFTGIIRGLFNVSSVERLAGLTRYAVVFTPDLLNGLIVGASVSIDGTCQTVAAIDGMLVWFEAIQETLLRTTLKDLYPGRQVNVERSARFGDEIGGHILSGHVFGVAEIKKREEGDGNCIITLQCPSEWTKYLFPKGYVALDGASLTLVDVMPSGLFTVHLIPETLRSTTFGHKGTGQLVNVEFDSNTMAIVNTMASFNLSVKECGQVRCPRCSEPVTRD